MPTNKKPNILVVIADFYKHIAELQLDSIKKTLYNHADYDIVNVPGALEIPVVIAVAKQTFRYDGYIALGCVIRGETTHYEIVSHESARALMDLSIHEHLAIGNGILTVENEKQALERADFNKLNKAGDAALACLKMINIFATLKE
jgi:6,7-dimethyl-8-ribityllumazine synthase